MKPHVLIAAALLFAASPSPAQQPSKWSGRVFVNIAADADIHTYVTSYINRELRGLGDVAITDSASDSDFSLQLIVTKVHQIGMPLLGYALSVVTSETMSMNFLRWRLSENKVPQKEIDGIISIYGQAQTDVRHYLEIANEEGLERKCREIVAEFDVKLLQPRRTQRQREHDAQTPKANDQQ